MELKAAIIDPAEIEIEMLTVREYADRQRVCEQTIYRLLWQKRIPGAEQVGSQWRIPCAKLRVNRQLYTPIDRR